MTPSKYQDHELLFWTVAGGYPENVSSDFRCVTSSQLSVSLVGRAHWITFIGSIPLSATRVSVMTKWAVLSQQDSRFELDADSTLTGQVIKEVSKEYTIVNL